MVLSNPLPHILLSAPSASTAHSSEFSVAATATTGCDQLRCERDVAKARNHSQLQQERPANRPFGGVRRPRRSQGRRLPTTVVPIISSAAGEVVSPRHANMTQRPALSPGAAEARPPGKAKRDLPACPRKNVELGETDEFLGLYGRKDVARARPPAWHVQPQDAIVAREESEVAKAAKRAYAVRMIASGNHAQVGREAKASSRGHVASAEMELVRTFKDMKAQRDQLLEVRKLLQDVVVDKDRKPALLEVRAMFMRKLSGLPDQ